ncbi:MAG: hypothetical protein OXF11_06005 [Deltaproteobacteria bacterium]|nr:hypothetical protein [Deltaproteobacteria bacterium]
MKKLVLESTAPFQGLCELVAYNEGLFEKEGIQVEFADRGTGDMRTHTDLTNPKDANPHASHGMLFEQGKADMYNACEWGNYCRVQDSAVDNGRQIGRRSIIAYSGLVVRPDSPVQTAQQLANRLVGVPFYFGTHYLAMHMLEGFLTRDQINLCQAPRGSRYRLESVMKGEIEATTLTEPYLTLAEKKGCRIVAAASLHGTEVAADSVDAETYAKFNRAVCEAVRRVNADKRKYLQYFIDYHKDDPEIAALTVDDLRESRLVVVDPAPIPADELERTAAWIKSWGLLDEDKPAVELVNPEVQSSGHAL